MDTIRAAVEYSNMTFNDVLELPCDVFALMVKNHYVDMLRQSEGGREYLKKCKRLNTTELDETALRKRMKGA